MSKKDRKRVKLSKNPKTYGNVDESNIYSKIRETSTTQGIAKLFKPEQVASKPSRYTHAFVSGNDRRARMMRTFYKTFINDIGGEDEASLAELEIIRRCSALAIIANEMESALAANDLDNFDFEQYIIVARTQASLLKTLGIRRRQKKVNQGNTLSDYLQTSVENE